MYPEDLISRFKAPCFQDSYFLSFEGIEGSGKSTQMKQVELHLKNKGHNVILLREPGGTTFGEKLREAILQSKRKLHPIAEAHLFASARAQILYEIILEKLKTPKTIVICDRYIDSSLAYQGHAGKLGVKTVLEIHKDFPLTTVPNLTFYIRISLETSMERQRIRNNQKDYFESQGKQFHQSLIDGYEEASRIFPDRITVIDGEKTPENVTKMIIEKTNLLLEGKLKCPT
ncbi:MAG: dTMP kinase [Bacteriovoracaceae bacterium]|nr:dTMP kinase [Bacteriovoracaceae bacterium]